MQNAVPGAPWLDEVHFVAGGLALAFGPFGFRRDLLARAAAWHRRWMVVSFALCFGAVTLRIQLAPLAFALGSFEAGYRVVSWSCWLPNLAFAVWWLARTDLAGRPRVTAA